MQKSVGTHCPATHQYKHEGVSDWEEFLDVMHNEVGNVNFCNATANQHIWQCTFPADIPQGVECLSKAYLVFLDDPQIRDYQMTV